MTALEEWDRASPAPDPERPHLAEVRPEVVAGGAFIFDDGEPVAALWGHDEAALWAEGESLFVVGPPGLGKSTLVQRVVLAQLGLIEPEVLGLPVRPAEGKVLYIAADRPRQIARSFRRMVTDEQRSVLDERLVIRKGPPAFDVVKAPWKLSVFVQSYGCSEVVVDSLKDLAAGLAGDEVGSAVNIAFQDCVAAGIDVLAIHHNRKPTSENPRPRALADVYGSSMLTNGAGSVLCIWAPEAGSPMVELHHVKQPAHEVGPLLATVDIEAGDFRVHEQVDLLTVLRGASRGLSAAGAAAVLFSKADPSRPDVEKARRKLDRLVTKNLASKQAGERDEAGRQGESLYFALTAAEPRP